MRINIFKIHRMSFLIKLFNINILICKFIKEITKTCKNITIM